MQVIATGSHRSSRRQTAKYHLRSAGGGVGGAWRRVAERVVPSRIEICRSHCWEREHSGGQESLNVPASSTKLWNVSI